VTGPVSGKASSAARVAVVTGAAGGIGRAIVARLGDEGFRVAAVDVDANGLEAMKANLHRGESVATFSFDAATDAVEGINRVASALGPPYALINNAGVIHKGDVLRTSDDDWARVIDNNLTAPFRMCRAVLPHMVEARRGVIVNLASIGGVIGLRERAAYCSAKAGLLGLTRAMAADYSGLGIRINAINPGTTATPMVESVIESSEDPVAMRELWASRQPIGRMGRPEEIAAAVAFLLSDDAAYMCGSTLTCDGGFSIV
jgi:2-keto-3-deoxy-L-fuconate dehydrogenase